jgi:two-component system CheB/CheR fusion protein
MSEAAIEPEPQLLYVVGVGASAGGLEALQRFFERMPRTGGFAFVVVQHLSPDFKSVMGELLTPHTPLTVCRVEDGVTVEADHVYLLPPRYDMIVSGGRLFLTERDPNQGLSLPIDAFFRSLAEDAGPRAVAVVLSGSGSDGSRGIRAVHEAGGLVIAQTEESAKFNGMPKSAIDTGVVDLVLPVDDVPAALIRYLEHDGTLAAEEPDGAGGDTMARILQLLRRESGIDFADYKASTVGRRIERRLLLSDSPDLDGYVKRVGEDPGELGALYRDLLIGVTRFFRDPDAFTRLGAEVLPGVLERASPQEEARVWIPACATGEEAYSLGILLLEAFRAEGRPPHFKIFATDVHRPSLEVASAGLYSPESVVNVPAELRERYFTANGDGYQISSELRGHIVFAHHNLLRDAPFTRLDLLSCRNLLIYFTPPAQRRVLALFHFALKTGGVLVLGPSESPGPLAEEFTTVDTRWKIFRKNRDIRINAELRLASPGAPEAAPRLRVPRQASEDPRVTRGRESLFERYAPPCLLVDELGRVLHTFNGAGEFLVQRDGRPSLNLFELLEGELRFVVAGALKRVQKDHKPVIFSGLRVATASSGARRVRVVVEWVEGCERSEPCYAVAFEPDPDEEAAAPPDGDPRVGDLLQERLASVEGELRLTKENLQATVEEMEASNEELQATNEELIASNEELQSTNEELHSVNEELYTVNAEYQAKIAELTELSADMNHLLEATEVHTVFLDRDLRLRKFTPKIAQTFNLLPQDVGRRLDAFAHNLDDQGLLPDLESVAAQGGTVEREVSDRQGRSYFLRILPYRALQTSEGVVLTLIDISALKQAQRELAISEERHRILVRSVTAILWTADRAGRFAAPQPEWEAYTGHGWEAHQGEGWLDSFHPDDRPRIGEAWRGAVEGRRLFEAEGRLYSKAHGDHRHVVLRAAPLLDEEGGAREWVGHVVDAHDSTTSQLELWRQQAQLRSIVDNSPAFIWVKDPAGRYVVAGRTCQALLGAPCGDVVGKSDHDFLPLELADAHRTSERKVLESGETFETEEQLPLGGQPRTVLTVRFPLRDHKDRVYAVAGISTDITERKRDAEEIREAVERRDRFLALLSHELRTPLGAVLNAADLLKSGEENGRPRGYARDIIRRQARHMAKLIEDLLDVSRITRDQLTLERTPLDLRPLIEEVVEVLRPAADEKGLDLRLEIPDQRLVVHGDSVRLRQIVTNLLNNAVCYTPSGRVEVLVSSRDGKVSVGVRDSGIGLGEEERTRVFEIFYQTAQPLDRKRGGLGVGLTLALKLARLHGGDIAVESAGPGQGALFTLTLPLVEAAAEQLLQPQASRPDGKLRIVLVEDSPDICDTLADLLRLEGHVVLCENEGVRGAAMIVQSCPDVAIVDVGLPGLDGYGVARAVRAARGSRVRLIALTGYGRREDRLSAAEAGFDRHLVKPVDHETLMRALVEIGPLHGEDAA